MPSKSNFVNPPPRSFSGEERDDIYRIKSDADKDIQFINFIELPSNNEFFQFGMKHGKRIGKKVLEEFPDFPEGIHMTRSSNFKTRKEMFEVVCLWKFYLPSKTNTPKDKMNDLYQNHENIPYPQVCAEVDKGLKKASRRVWKMKLSAKNQKLAREKKNTAEMEAINKRRPIPEVQVNYPF